MHGTPDSRMTPTPAAQRRLSPTRLTLLSAVVALLTTAAVTLLPFLRFAYKAPALHVVLETLAAVTALLVAFLVLGRFRQSRRVQELLLALALGVVAVANLLLAALPTALNLGGDTELGRWAPLVLRLLGTCLLAAAALTPLHRVAPSRRAPRWAAVAVGVVVVVLVVALALVDQLPAALPPSVDLQDAERPLIVGHPLVLAAQVAGGLLYPTAAVAFTRQATRTGDELIRWLGAGCAFAAFARANYFLFPSLYSEYVYTGDLLRLVFYLFLLVGAGKEITSFWQARSHAAVLEERRRMARDLHDGLAQELSYIWSQSEQLARRSDDAQVAERIGGAAGRALDEARRAIDALTRLEDQPFDQVLQRALDDLASRYDVRVTTDLAPEAVVRPDQCEALLRIVGEAVRNAVRHGRAGHVRVTLRGNPVELTVQDDGAGFTPATASSQPGGFGLISMRERAEALGAQFSIDSAVETGTRVQVRWS